MKVNVGVKREEAIRRLEILKERGMTYTPPLKAFKSGEDIGIFENMGYGAEAIYYALYLNTGDDGFYDKLAQAVKEFEAQHNAVVYLILVTHSEFGTMCDMFYVSDYKSEWEQDVDDLKNGYSCVYCCNMDEPMFSEIGSIAFKASKLYGGIYREE